MGKGFTWESLAACSVGNTDCALLFLGLERGEAGIHFICMFFRSAITAWLAAEFSVKGPAF